MGAMVAEEYLTIPEVVAELRVPRSTFTTGANSDADRKRSNCLTVIFAFGVATRIPGCVIWRSVSSLQHRQDRADPRRAGQPVPHPPGDLRNRGRQSDVPQRTRRPRCGSTAA